MKRLATSVLLVFVSLSSLAAEGVGPVDITRIRTGWSSDSFAVETAQPVVNPANCPTPDGYQSASNDPGHKTYLSATLTAFSMAKPISIIVSDAECTAGRPKIMGVYLTR